MDDEKKQQRFIPGLILAESFFNEAVEPILDSHYPSLKYSAALIGSVSEVLEDASLRYKLKALYE